MKLSEITAYLAIIFAVLILVLGFWYSFHSIFEWNGGICPRCGEPYQSYEYLYDGTTTVHYECNNCGNFGDISPLIAY